MEPFKATAPDGLKGFYPLDREQIERYREWGYIVLRGVAADDEIRAWREALVPLIEELSAGTHHVSGPSGTGGEERILNLWTKSEIARGFSSAERFGHIANELMGTRAVRLYHDQALFKPVGSGFSPLRQDQTLWPIDAQALTMWMPLADLEPGMGLLRVADGSHRSGDLSEAAGDAKALEALAAQRGWKIHELEPLKAGDAVFYDGWLLAGTTENQADRTREVMAVIFMDAEAKIAEPHNEDQRRDLATWLAGRKAGENADTEINPVVYSSGSRRP